MKRSALKRLVCVLLACALPVPCVALAFAEEEADG